MTLCKATLLVLCLYFSVAHSDEPNCYSGSLHGSQCVCKNLLWSHNPEDEFGARIACSGGSALQAAIEIKNTQSDLEFIQVSCTGGDLETLRFSDMGNFKSVRYLNFSSNRISAIDIDAFEQQNYIYLDLSNNRLSNLKNKIFKPLLNMKNLSLSQNWIETIEPEAFFNLYGLISLDLSHNRISSINNAWFAATKNLQHLVLSHNSIESIHNNSFHLFYMQRLDLSYNNLKVIPTPSPFYRLKGLKFLSLAMNQLTTLDEGVFKGNSMIDKVNLIGNAWVCDKKILFLKDWLKKHEANRGGAMCAEPLQNYTLQNGLDNLYLEIKIAECDLCNASLCDCVIARDKQIVTVNCSNRGLTKLPEKVPYMTKSINLHGNKIRSVSIDHVDAALWSNVSFLYLNGNVVDSLKGLENSWLLRNLVALHLSGNRITEVPIHILEQLRGGFLDELYLSGNPWTCDCNTVRFQTWLQDNYRVVRNFDGIRCSSDGGLYSDQPISRLKKSQLCPQQVQPINYLDVVNGMMAVVIVLLVVKLSYDYWLQKRTGKLPRFFSLNL